MLRVVPAPPARDRPNASRGRSATRSDRITHLLFVCDDAGEVQLCLRRLGEAHFDVAADIVTDIANYVERLHQVAYDAVISCGSFDTGVPLRALDLLKKDAPDVPFILVAQDSQPGVVERFISIGAFDWVDKNQIELLPVSVAVALEHRRARMDEDRTLKALKGAQALHRALVDNPTYGICQFDSEGRLLDVNQALVDMLGYESRAELTQLNIALDVTLDRRQGAQLLAAYHRTGQVATRQMVWKRKVGRPLVVRLGGRHVWDESTASCELIVADVTADRARETHLQRLATTDPLTGLANYRQFTHALDAETRRADRTGRPFSVLLFDLDGLKGINDRYGHEAGNQALCRLSAALRHASRSLDTVARCGGDEFGIVLPETGAKGAALIGRRICARLARDHQEPRLSVSVGIAVYPHDGVSMPALLRAADLALYTMKGEQCNLAVANKTARSIAKRHGRR